QQQRRKFGLADQLVWWNVRLNNGVFGQMELWHLKRARSRGCGQIMRRLTVRCRILAWIHAAVCRVLPPHWIRQCDVDLTHGEAICSSSHVDSRRKDKAICNQADHENVQHARNQEGEWLLLRFLWNCEK